MTDVPEPPSADLSADPSGDASGDASSHPADLSADPSADPSGDPADLSTGATRDLADVPAAEVIAAVAVHLMSAAAVKCGLADAAGSPTPGPGGAGAGAGTGAGTGQGLDLDEARKLITALAGLVTAARPDLGVHAAPLRDGLQSLQRAFREASPLPDEPGEGPGERLTGRV